MKFTFPQLLAGGIGALLIYCAIVNKTPVQVMKDAMNGATAPAVKTGSGNNPAATTTTPYTGAADLTANNTPLGQRQPRNMN